MNYYWKIFNQMKIWSDKINQKFFLTVVMFNSSTKYHLDIEKKLNGK